MYEHLDLKAQTVEYRSELGTIYRSEIWTLPQVNDATVWTGVITLDKAAADSFTERLNQALFADECNICGGPAQYIDHFGNLETDTTDILSWCSPTCRRDDREGSLL